MFDELLNKTKKVNEGSFGYDGRYTILYDILNSRLGHMVAAQIQDVEEGNPHETNGNALNRIMDVLVQLPDSIEGKGEIYMAIDEYLNDDSPEEEDDDEPSWQSKKGEKGYYPGGRIE